MTSTTLQQWAENGWLREHDSSPEEMQSLLAHTIELDAGQVRILDTFRRKRNISVYDSAGEITEAEPEEALRQAEAIARRVRAWLDSRHPGLMGAESDEG